VYHFPELYSVQSIVKKSSSIYAQCNLYTSSFTSSLYYFLKSPDNGQNWYLQQTDSSNGQVNGLIWKIRCLNDSTCFGLSEKALYKTTNGGGALGQQVGFLYETTGVVDVKLNNNFLSPNPATQSISVSNIPPNSKFKIINPLGTTIMESYFNFENEIDVTQLSNGVYFIQIHSGNNIRTAKFIKQ
jgi:hypothetical protein